MDLSQVQAQIRAAKIVLKPVDSLTPYARNARTHSEAQIEQIARSIQEFGFTNPILVDAAGEIIAGHGRLLGAKKAGMTEVPCIELGHLSPAQKRAYVLTDNVLALQAGWDEGLLSSELVQLKQMDFDLTLTGFDDSELKRLQNIFEQGERDESGAGKDKDDLPPEPEVIFIKRGDLYKLGEHRILCGDATDPADAAKVMGGELADLILTDPPYNVGYEGTDGQTIQNDKMSNEAFGTFCRGFYDNYFKVLKPGASIYVFHSDSMGHIFRQTYLDAGFYYSGCLIWNKNSLVMGRFDYHMKHEPIIYGWKPGASHRWFSDRTQTTVIDHDKPKHNDIHPTMKPVALLEYLLGNSSQAGEVVVDFFGGSGSTMMACEAQGRKCRSIELDPKYMQRSIARWEAFTGKKAEKIG